MATASTLTLLALVCSCWLFTPSAACAACVQLGEYTFDKLLTKFDATLVKFDVAFPYGEKHEAYSELAKDAKAVDRLLVAEVGVKDYGERDNEVIAKKYGLAKDDYPAVRLFVRGRKEPIAFTDADFTADALRKFVKREAGIHLSLPGCLPELDKLAFQFVAETKTDKRREVLKKVGKAVAGYDAEKQKIGKIYQLIMDKMLEKGDDFVKSETNRVKKLSDGKLSPEKKRELNYKLNILLSFNNNKAAKEEL